MALQTFATTGYGSSAGAGLSGAGWDGQMRSLQTDRMQHKQYTDMKNDVRHALTTSSHIMGQGGSICKDWKAVQLQGTTTPSTLNLSMGHITGNCMSGQSNLFNQYQICRLKKFKIIFKDVVVALETSTSTGLQLMSDVVAEFRRRPYFEYMKSWEFPKLAPGPTDLMNEPPDAYPDWWQDWRPVTDGAVEFEFDVNSREIPAFIASARKVGSSQFTTDTDYQTLGQFLYGAGQRVGWAEGTTSYSAGTKGMLIDATMWNLAYFPYTAAVTNNWLDFFFEWRVRNCPASANINTYATYNIQIDAEWEMSYRTMAINDMKFPATSTS